MHLLLHTLSLIDYRVTNNRLEFEINGNTTHCFNIEIISDIAFEGSKNFSLNISIVPSNRVFIGAETVVTIVDYNGEWNSSNNTAGLQSLLISTQ